MSDAHEPGCEGGVMEPVDRPIVAEEKEEPILKYFRWAHLSEPLQAVSRPFFVLALQIMRLPRSAERTVALRKLLESKDAAVRAAIP